MKAVVQDKYGPPDEVLALREVDKPMVKDDEVLVRVRAASMHPDVWHAVTGWPYFMRAMGNGLRKPKRTIPGTDLAGHVESIGKNVTRFKPGDEVYGDSRRLITWLNGGTFAEYAAAPEAALAVKPRTITFEQAAAVPISGFIALGNLRIGKITAGQHVLINGAGGCVGSLAVQIAKAEGLRVTGVDCAEKLDMIRGLGADHVIDYMREDFTQGSERFDFILDVASTLSLREAERVLTPNGLYWLVGHEHFRKQGGSVWGSTMPRYFGFIARARFDRHLPRMQFKVPTKQDILDVMNGLHDLLESGKLTPIIAKTFPLSEVPAAMRCMQEGKAVGRIIITP